MASAETKLPQAWSEVEKPSIIHLLGNVPRMLKAIDALPENILAMGERKLEHKIRQQSEDGKFPRQLGLCKIAFWEDYRHSHQERRVMRSDNWHHGICHKTWFYENVIDNPLNLAWLLTPPTDEMLLQKEILGMGMKKLRQVMDSDIYIRKTVKKPDGTEKMERSVNVPLVKEMHAIIKTLQDRVHGAVIQRQQIESHNKNVTVTKNLNPSLSSPDLTMDQLEAFETKIAQIKNTLDLALPAATDVDNP